VSIAVDLTGRRVVVTGGGSGIGQACASRLAEAGARVVVADLRLGPAEAVAAEICAAGGDASAMELDVADIRSCHDMAAAVAATGGTDGLVNCAATWTLGGFVDSAPEQWQRDVGVTLMGTLSVTHALLPQLIASGAGSVVNISSDAARVGERGQVVYAAAKAGVIGFSKALAKEVGRQGVRVNCIAPGLTRTPASAAFVEDLTQADIARAYPLGRIGEPQDIADLVLFLSSGLSGWITGQTISVSGGYTTAG
jgi:NAD(P)-dependent dehydrogenase (short-subunit alcohol dehydrogenase family)